MAFVDFYQDLETLDAIFEDEYIDEILGLETMLTEKSQVAALRPQEWGKLKCNPDAQGVETCKEMAIKMYEDIAVSLKASLKDFRHRLAKSARKVKNPKVLVGVKPLKSVLEKIFSRGKKIEKLTDLLRGAVILETGDDVEKVVKQIRKDFRIYEMEFKGKREAVKTTYAKDGDKRSAIVSVEPGDNKYGYFGSWHFLVDQNGIITEVQVMTRKLWAYKKEAHKIYKELRAAGDDIDKQIEKAKLNMSKHIFNVGNRESKFLTNRRRG